MKKLLLVFMFLIHLSVFSQNVEITVALKDYETNLPIEDASITVLNTNQGLVSNMEGVFKLSLDKPSKIKISHASYKTITVNSASLKLKENIIYMDRNTKILEEVIITTKHPQEILKKLVENSSDKLTIPVNLKIYVREFFKKNDKYTSFNDGLLNFYIQGRPTSVKTDILVEQNRFYGLINDEVDESTLGYNLNDIIGNYYEFKYLNKVVEAYSKKKYDYEIKTYPNNEDYYLMNIRPLPNIDGYYPDFFIVYDYKKNIIIEINSSVLTERYEFKGVTDFLVIKGKIFNSVFNATYKYDGKNYYLSSSKEEIGFKTTNKKKEEERIEVKNYLVTTNFSKKPVPYDKSDVYKEKSLFNKRNTILTNYWEFDSGLTPTEEEKQIIESLASKL
ncbi:MAG TPA: carboxypeptidase-like regulatory domain-containing protein [Flavobacterium sp.]|uniref:carboxypeptidase-like regulatory domain-containing protein n=1 Tax=Flavobacterium sp. TaxID=239 RepID=UPI002C87AC1F|nr:carboxypeptidase-like regulatory domain-containing protein [Flavobacterium sp.]HSD14215.1 carboxypeptidase-like regulatory domain-containing protein [Flavobacterium sp.]